jgi:hypothetical protein
MPVHIALVGLPHTGPKRTMTAMQNYSFFITVLYQPAIEGNGG